MFDRIKRFFAENDIVLKFSCCRKCLGKVVDEDIDMDVDINNDNKPDINITVEDGILEVTTITDDGVKSNADGKDIGDVVKDVLENVPACHRRPPADRARPGGNGAGNAEFSRRLPPAGAFLNRRKPVPETEPWVLQ